MSEPTILKQSTALAIRPDARASVSNLGQYLNGKKKGIAAAAASLVKPDRLLKVVLNNVMKTPALQKCSVESVFRATLGAAELGLEPGGALGLAYLVPYKDECQLIVGYRGLIDLAYRGGQISTIRANVVYQGDKFDYKDGLDLVLDHHPNPEAERDPTKITYAYCVVRTKDGGAFVDVMTRGEIDRIRGRSRSGSNGPWVSDYAEMARKTVARRCLKYVPMSVELRRAIEVDDAMETGSDAVELAFADYEIETTETPSATDRLGERLALKTGESEGDARPEERIGKAPQEELSGDKDE